MRFRSVLITGGAGFVGANLAVAFREHFPDVAVTSFDNLSRRGSELNLVAPQEPRRHVRPRRRALRRGRGRLGRISIC